MQKGSSHDFFLFSEVSNMNNILDDHLLSNHFKELKCTRK